jgi:hypothetical protein
VGERPPRSYGQRLKLVEGASARGLTATEKAFLQNDAKLTKNLNSNSFKNSFNPFN